MKTTELIIGASLMLFIVIIGWIFYVLIRREGMHVTSWWRTPWHNKEVGGVRTSLHMIGLAWDCVPVTRQNEEKLRGLGLVVINEGDHLHAQLL